MIKNYESNIDLIKDLQECIEFTVKLSISSIHLLNKQRESGWRMRLARSLSITTQFPS